MVFVMDAMGDFATSVRLILVSHFGITVMFVKRITVTNANHSKHPAVSILYVITVDVKRSIARVVPMNVYVGDHGVQKVA